MCITCYEERYGAPCVLDGQVRQAAKLIADIYEDSAVGGGAHIVVDDWNLEDDSIDWCLTQLEVTVTERICLMFLKDLSLEQRASALALYHGDIKDIPSFVTETE